MSNYDFSLFVALFAAVIWVIVGYCYWSWLEYSVRNHETPNCGGLLSGTQPNPCALCEECRIDARKLIKEHINRPVHTLPPDISRLMSLALLIVHIEYPNGRDFERFLRRFK